MAIVVYEKRTCTTCRNLAKLLEWKSLDRILELAARDLLRMREEGARELADADNAEVVAAMVARPELLQRPIVVNGDRAVLARPVERVLEIL